MAPTQPSPPSATTTATIERLRQLSQTTIQATWHWHQTDISLSAIFQQQVWSHWPIAPLNSRQHIAWPQGQQPLWLCQKITIPTTLNGYSIEAQHLKLALTWWADQAQVFLDGSLVQQGDLFDCFTRISLSPAAQPGHSVVVALRLISPGHDDGALVRSQLIYEAPPDTPVEPGFIADELSVLQLYISNFAPQQQSVLDTALTQINWAKLDHRDQFHQSLETLRQHLTPLGNWVKQRHIHMLGHAHLDLAWLWPLEDTWQAAERTFESVLALQKTCPELTYTHSSPALFAWLEANRPDLFQAIQQQVNSRRWAIDAGLWVEPELNLISGESIVRQILYGQRYCQEKFAHISPIAWLPDSFGFCWQLPQLLSQGGIRYFATQKLRWNDTNAFPHDLFWWQGLDGTRILSLTLPPIGSDIDPITMATYACTWEANTGFSHSLWLPGIGDHGGGPTRDMLEKASRWANSPFFPQLSFTHAVDFLQTLENSLKSGIPSYPSSTSPTPTASSLRISSEQPRLDGFHFSASAEPTPSLPVWTDELYLELHRGCYTTHAEQKWYNRHCEDLLYQAELFASIATMITACPYPQAKLETAWKQILFNQFHDILPGSAIPEVFETANQTWQSALDTGTYILQQALTRLAHAIAIPSPPHPQAIPVVLFNPLNWAREEVVSLPLPPEYDTARVWQGYTTSGQPLTTQISPDPADAEAPPSLLVHGAEIPSVGHQLIWLVPTDQPAPTPPAADETWVLENSLLKVTLDPTTGTITSLIHKTSGRETLKAPGNDLQAFQDKGQYWDAWNIAPDYQDHPLETAQLRTMAWLDCGPLRQRLRVVKTLNQSTIIQDYILDRESGILDIHTQVDWHETQVLLKAAFPVTVAAPYATYDIPYGAIKRSTLPDHSHNAAKWEVPALRWADLSQPDYGVSLITDSKHGFDATTGQLRLTLLKAPLWPDPNADRGHHSFRYSLYPHAADWQTARTVQLAHNKTIPIQPCWLQPQAAQGVIPGRSSLSPTFLPPTMSYLDLGDSTLVLSTLKLSESRDDHFILRCYESTGEPSNLTVNSPLPFTVLGTADILEHQCHTLAINQDLPLSVSISPWQVVNLLIQLADEANVVD